MARRGMNRRGGGGPKSTGKPASFPQFTSGGALQQFAEQPDSRRTRAAGSNISEMVSSNAEPAEAVVADKVQPSTKRTRRQLRISPFSSTAREPALAPTVELNSAVSFPRTEVALKEKARPQRSNNSIASAGHRGQEWHVGEVQPTNACSYQQEMAVAPKKCLLSDERFRRLSGMVTDRYVERGPDGCYQVHPEQELFDGQISTAQSVDELSDDQIRYLFYRIEDDLRGLAADGRSTRHRLFMADRSDVLNFAMPFSEYTDRQRTLIRNLCQDHLRIKSGFNDFYLMQVIIPEACIRIHMAVHGTTFEESDAALDPGLVNLKEAVDNLDMSGQIPTTRVTLASILDTEGRSIDRTKCLITK
ncbi:hypothetical protein BIW11_11509 [Tropilaelaps mercedesae]|uniref:Uncharacterized protein n=1 Tax=Tropilaelaps mercedesae TaxID=418985 RepID=A0A1V9XB91_9ACAR|nr:hypothetical protein BIW11_11509 [Tropilaelaps mercedesae]